MRKSRKNKANDNTSSTNKSKSEKVSKMLDIPIETFNNISRIEVLSNTESILEGCTGVLEYDDNIIRLGTKKHEIKYFGMNLVLKCLNNQNVIVEGQIQSIEFIN